MTHKTSPTNNYAKIFAQTLADGRRWTAVMGTALLLGALWIWLSAAPGPAAEQTPSPRAGFAAPDFSLESLSGESVTLSDLHGQVVMINLWASWCVPCRREMPAIDAVFRDRREEGLVVLAVNSTFQDSEPAASAFVEEFGFAFPVLLDRDGAVSRRYLLQALPTTFFVDRAGVIREVVFGGNLDEPLIKSKIDPLLAEVPPS